MVGGSHGVMSNENDDSSVAGDATMSLVSQRAALALMEILGGVVEVLEDDVGALLHAGFCVDAAGVGALANAQAVVIDQLAGILGQGLGGCLVDIPVEGVPLGIS